MSKTQLLLKKHSSTILTVIGAMGVVATSILSVKATPKALALLEDAKQEKGEELSIKETIQVAWKPYIPAVLTGFGTIACIFGANYLSTRNQASLMSAYALLDRTYKEYQNKVKEVSGPEKELSLREELLKDKYDGEVITTKYENDISEDEDKLIFYDNVSSRFFVSTMQRVMEAECKFKEAVEWKGYGFLNQYYDMLGIPRVDYGYQLGWTDVENNDPYNCASLEFNYEKVSPKEGVEIWIIRTNVPPATDYIL